MKLGNLIEKVQFKISRNLGLQRKSYQINLENSLNIPFPSKKVTITKISLEFPPSQKAT